MRPDPFPAAEAAPRRAEATPAAVARARERLLAAVPVGWPASVAVCCDFDGVVAEADLCNAILERFADPEWFEIEKRWLRGELSSRDALPAQYASVRASRGEIEAFVAQAPVAEGFAEFARFARENAVPLLIISDGLDIYIEHTLRRIGAPEVPFFANRALPSPAGTGVEFPHSDDRCAQCAVCKTAFVEAARGLAEEVVYVGDGLSDWCASHRASRTCAKGRLLDMRRRFGPPCRAFRGFGPLQEELRGMLDDA